MPAVSTKRHSLPPSSTISSTGSRVVPASSLTTTRSSPAALFSSEDLPTFGRPRIATRRGPPISCLATAEISGSTFMISSSRSATPRPWIADTGYGSPRPEVPEGGGLGLVAGVVDLVGDEEDGLAALAEQLHDVLVGRGGADHRVDDEHHDVAEVDRDLGLRGDGASMPRASGSQPPVSTSVKRRSIHSALYVTRSRVTPGVSSTTASRRPRMRFTSADLPTFGRPTIATTGSAGRNWMPSSPSSTPASSAASSSSSS